VNSMNYMFYKSQFNQDISQWNVSNVIKCTDFHDNSPQTLNHLPIRFAISPIENGKIIKEFKHLNDIMSPEYQEYVLNDITEEYRIDLVINNGEINLEYLEFFSDGDINIDELKRVGWKIK